jgi:hypothetical protein
LTCIKAPRRVSPQAAADASERMRTMADADLKALGEEIEAAEAVAGDLEDRARAALRAASLPQPSGFGSVDAVLGVIDTALPGWEIALDGEASAGHGHWRCSLRRSSRTTDGDMALGAACARHPATALAAALFKALAAVTPR